MPKQFCDLCGRPVVMLTIDRVRKSLPAESNILLVVSEPMIGLWKDLCRVHSFESPEVIVGGSTRWQSVRNAIGAICVPDKPGDVILVHDAARPLISPAVVGNLIEAIAAGADGAVPTVAVTDSIRLVNQDGTTTAVDRSLYRAVQTPQAFPAETLRRAYSLPYSPLMTDDASVCEAAGFTNIVIVEGDHRTLKITHPADMATVAHFMNNDGSTAGN